MSFEDLIPEEKILRAVKELYSEPTPIQRRAIPLIIQGLDLRASAETGTGKSAAFILPSLCRLMKEVSKKGMGPRILILVPTRELALQVSEEVKKYTKYLPQLRTVCIFGGTPYPEQNRQLSRPYDVLVATPGRLIDHIERKRVSFHRLELLILDEADRMLDMGFIHAVEKIAALTPKERQTLMFSATLKGSVMKLSHRLLNQPQELSVETSVSKSASIEQFLHAADNLEHKYKLLNHFLRLEEVGQAIVFTATKRQADRLAEKLQQEGLPAAALHGDMNQGQRTRTVARLRQGKVRFLIATDVAARGIDIPEISHVFNFDVPHNEEDYVHRIGRTGRAGATGATYLFATREEMGIVRLIERFIGHKMRIHVVPGLEATFKERSPLPKPSSRKPPFRSFKPRRR